MVAQSGPIASNRGRGTTRRGRGANPANLHSIDRRVCVTRSRVRNQPQDSSSAVGTISQNVGQETLQQRQAEQSNCQHDLQQQQGEIHQVSADDLLQGNLNAALGAIESANPVVTSANLSILQGSVEVSDPVSDSMPAASVSNVILPCSMSDHSVTNANNPFNTQSGSIVSNAIIAPSTQSCQTMSTSSRFVNSMTDHSMPLMHSMQYNGSLFNNHVVAPSTHASHSVANQSFSQSICTQAMQTGPIFNASATMHGNSMLSNPLHVPTIQSGPSLVNISTSTTVVTQAMPSLNTSTLTTSMYGGSSLSNVQGTQALGIQAGQSLFPTPVMQSLPSVNTSIPIMQTIHSIDPSFQQIQTGFSPLNSVCNPLGSMVPQAMKSKIMNGEYVDFADLLQKRETLDPDQIESGVALSVNENGAIVWKRNKPKHQIVSINTWSSAFLVYSSIYLQRHPSRVQELLKYADIVITAASRFGGWGWRSYDQQFRMRQQSQPSRSWSIIDGELWALYVATSANRAISDRSFHQRRVTTGGSVSSFKAEMHQTKDIQKNNI